MIRISVGHVLQKRLFRTTCRFEHWLTWDQRSMYSVGVKVGRIHLPPRGVKTPRCGLLWKFFDHLLYLCWFIILLSVLWRLCAGQHVRCVCHEHLLTAFAVTVDTIIFIISAMATVSLCLPRGTDAVPSASSSCSPRNPLLIVYRNELSDPSSTIFQSGF